MFKTWYQKQINSGLLSVEIRNQKLDLCFVLFQLESFKNRAFEKEKQWAETLKEVSFYNGANLR